MAMPGNGLQIFGTMRSAPQHGTNLPTPSPGTFLPRGDPSPIFIMPGRALPLTLKPWTLKSSSGMFRSVDHNSSMVNAVLWT